MGNWHAWGAPLTDLHLDVSVQLSASYCWMFSRGVFTWYRYEFHSDTKSNFVPRLHGSHFTGITRSFLWALVLTSQFGALLPIDRHALPVPVNSAIHLVPERNLVPPRPSPPLWVRYLWCQGVTHVTVTEVCMNLHFSPVWALNHYHLDAAVLTLSSLRVVLIFSTTDENIILNTSDVVKSLEDDIHASLKNGRILGYSERETFVAVKATMLVDGYILLTLGVYRHLLVRTCKIQLEGQDTVGHWVTGWLSLNNLHMNELCHHVWECAPWGLPSHCTPPYQWYRHFPDGHILHQQPSEGRKGQNGP